MRPFKFVKSLSDQFRRIYQAGPWYLSINRRTRACEATSGDYWFPVSRCEALDLLFRRVGYPAPANGIALTFGGTLVCIDLLDKGSSLEKIWSRYQEGLLIDLLERQRPEREITGAEISASLDQMQHLPWQQVEPVGLGEQYRAHDNSMLAAALVLDGKMIHGSALMPFPR